MPLLKTKHFGSVPYTGESELEFPCGLPGFDNRRRFLPLRFDHTDPLIYFQSMEDPDLCFLTVPVLVLDREYRLAMNAEDLETIGLAPDFKPCIGEDVLCVAVLSMREDGSTANLLAPLVVNPGSRKGVQAVLVESGYSHQHALFLEEAAVCS